MGTSLGTGEGILGREIAARSVLRGQRGQNSGAGDREGGEHHQHHGGQRETTVAGGTNHQSAASIPHRHPLDRSGFGGGRLSLPGVRPTAVYAHSA
ncbi:MAG TPA: hypothetical protein VKA47_02870 [Solirubrobacterales bacterium]|nr:hypothetical protein [Solirubrobacterales bacterium]